jgi:xylan 1,4-beta-xylosidase
MFSASRDAVKNGVPLSVAMRNMFFLPEDAKRWEKGALAKMDKEAKRQVGDRPLFITEWNSMAVFGSPVHDEKYSAAFAVKSCLDLDGSAQAYMFWCCSDLFEEQFMLPRPFVGSYGVVSNDGIPKPNFWGFKLLSGLYPNRLKTEKHDKIDFGAFTDGKNVQILLTPQSGDYYENERYEIEFTLDFAAAGVSVQRIDDAHCNPKRAWAERGEPDNLTPAEVSEIREKTRLIEEPLAFTAENGKTSICVALSTNDVYLITVKPEE